MRGAIRDFGPTAADPSVVAAQATSLLPTQILGIGGSAGALPALMKMLSHMDPLLVRNTSIIVQLHAPQQVAPVDPDRLLQDISIALGDLVEAKDLAPPLMRVEELPSVFAPLRPGVVYVCEPSYVVSLTQVGEIKRLRDDKSNTSSITTLLSELAVVQNHGLVVTAVGVVWPMVAW